jgi:hypothetical protein
MTETYALRAGARRLFGLAAVLLTLPTYFLSPFPTMGIDVGWVYWLHRIAEDRLPWGSDAVFTYGPLGWIAVPQYEFRLHYLVSIIVCALCTWSIVAPILKRVEQPGWRTPLLLVVCVVLMFALLPALPERFLGVLMFHIVLHFIRKEKIHSARWTMGFAAATGALWLIKLSVGVVGLAFLMALLIWDVATSKSRITRLRSAGLLVVAPVFALISFVLGFITIGHSNLSDVSRYLKDSLNLALFYGDNMSAAYAPIWTFLLVPIMGLSLLLLMPRSLRVFVPISLSLLIVFRLGFTRHDLGHMYSVMGLPLFTLLAAKVASDKGEQPRTVFAFSPQRYDVVLLAATAWFTVLGIVFANHTLPTFEAQRVKASLKAVGGLVSTKFTNGDRVAVVSAQQKTVTEVSDLLKSNKVNLETDTIGIEPYDLGLHWALGIARPRQNVIFQRYQSYSPQADNINASFLRESGPKYILYRVNAVVDGRLASAESPRTTVAILRLYDNIASSTNNEWVLMKRRSSSDAAKPRCFPTVIISAAAPSPIRRLFSTLVIPIDNPTVMVDGKLRRLTTASFDTPVAAEPSAASSTPADQERLLKMSPVSGVASVTPGSEVCQE